MTTQDLNFDDATPVKTATAVPVDIIAQQRAAGMPSALLSMQVDPVAIAAGQVRPQRYLDGMVIAEGTTNLIGFDGGAGKSTSIRHAGIKAAATGLFDMLGERQHDKPLRVALLFGEETGEQISQSIMSIPGAYEHYMTAIKTGRLLIVSMLDYMERAERPESIFDKEGRLTPTGVTILQDLADFRPDLVVFDTLGSMSDSEYLDSLSPRNTLNILNGFCARNRCTAIAYLHLTKDAGGKFGPESSPGELLALSRGSAQLKNVTRSLIVATRAPAGMYPGIQVAAGDEVWIGTTKCNLQNAKYNNQFFPIVRDSARMIMTAYGAGKALADEADLASKAAFKTLCDYLPHLIRAASEACKPFPVSKRNRFSLQTMLTGPMSGIFGDLRLSDGLITSALEALLRVGKIVECSDTRAAGAMVYCVPGGNFADPAGYRALTGEELKIRKGDYPVDELRDRMHELHDAAQRGEPIQTAGAAADDDTPF
ncbi:AAA family ATPase [Paracoccus sp. MA]|uniref:AAA family ATPase n=1 Tax=Paracoccus sp. MA TaxID=2895796 RepID=UPI001E5DEC16|nr:AAA family ATPase [Paracoccus sp. MA]UFM66807.1 AAA family ATPase [Paracoccus sp. MA]